MKDVSTRALALEFLAQRHRWEKMPPGSAACDYHLHLTAGRRESASSEPSAASAITIDVPP